MKRSGKRQIGSRPYGISQNCTQLCKTAYRSARQPDTGRNIEDRFEAESSKQAQGLDRQKSGTKGNFKRQVAVHLGKRVQFVDILNEKDCMKVKPKGWTDKQVWKEINDILGVHQFAWLSNGKDSRWIKMQG